MSKASNIAVGVPKQGASGFSYSILGGDAYTAGSGTKQELAHWNPSLRSPDREVLPARNRVVARSRDLDRNNGWTQGGINKRVEAVVGANIRLRYKPDFAAMGQSAEWAAEFARQVESLWRGWANDPRMLCDVERHSQFGGLVMLAYRHYLIDGEAAAPIMFIDDRGGIMSTSVLALDPDRISNPYGQSDSELLRGGIELDRYGAEVAYWVRRAHQSDIGTWRTSGEWDRLIRETKTGAPRFVHVINRRRAHQHRAVGFLSSVMGRVKMLDAYDSRELLAQIRRSVFGLYVESKMDTADVIDGFEPEDSNDPSEYLEHLAESRAMYHEKTDVSMENVDLAHLAPGEAIKAVQSDDTQSNFEAFEMAVLGSIAAPLGISREQLSQNWSGINYSSARALLNEIWRGLNADRHIFSQSFCSPIFAAFLEEAVARDLIQIPGGKAMFYVHRTALLQCEWLGPPRGTVDPLKEASANEKDLGIFATTHDQICNERGLDFREVAWQRKREEEMLKEYGLGGQKAEGRADEFGADEEPVDPSADPEADPDEADRQSERESQGDIA